MVLRLVLTAALLLVMPVAGNAVILYRTADPAENTNPPMGDLAGSGWQFQGAYSVFLGTPIAPQFFITARHLGGPAPFHFHGVTYNPVRGFPDPAGGDFTIWQIAPAEAFPFWAPLYTASDELEKPLVVFGRGTLRGDPVLLNNELRGWFWGGSDHLTRWGTNHVSEIVPFSLDNDGLRAAFDANGSAHEAHLSSGDSGGAVFIQHDGAWKLAGINYAVDDLYSQPNDSGYFRAAVFDARGFYERTGQNSWSLITGEQPVPTGFYSTRISSRLPWIYSVTDPLGDNDADGVRHLLEYALHLSPTSGELTSLPRVTREGANLVLTYNRRVTATDVVYTIEQSQDLVEWSNAAASEEVVSTVGTFRTIRATVAAGEAEQLFLRVRVTRP